MQISCRKMHMLMLRMWCKCLNQYSWKFKNSLQHFCSKSRLSCLILNFGDHHQEFFRVRSSWCFEKFSSTSLDLFPKISQFDWKWDIWKLFLGLAHEFSTIEHRKKRFLFWWISNKFNAPFLNPEHSILTDVKINRNGFKGSGQDISVLDGSNSRCNTRTRA